MKKTKSLAVKKRHKSADDILHERIVNRSKKTAAKRIARLLPKVRAKHTA